MKNKTFKPVLSVFGGIDERATQDAFVDFVGGTGNADRLCVIWCNSYACETEYDKLVKSPYYKTREQVFRNKAISRGFKNAEVDAFLMLQGLLESKK